MMKADQSGQNKYDSGNDSVGGADDWPDSEETDTTTIESAIQEPSIDELLAETDVRPQRHDEELPAE